MGKMNPKTTHTLTVCGHHIIAMAVAPPDLHAKERKRHEDMDRKLKSVWEMRIKEIRLMCFAWVYKDADV